MTAHPADAIDREREYWNAHAEFDWMDDRSKRETIAMLPALRGDVLELCIGSGLLVDQIPRTYASYTGLDISQPLLDTLHRRMPDLTLLQGDAEELPFEDRRFDAVLVFAACTTCRTTSGRSTTPSACCARAACSSASSRTRRRGTAHRCGRCAT
jgi:SAM-dependent methyltransferase